MCASSHRVSSITMHAARSIPARSGLNLLMEWPVRLKRLIPIEGRFFLTSGDSGSRSEIPSSR